MAIPHRKNASDAAGGQTKTALVPEIVNWKIDNQLQVRKGKCSGDGFTPSAVLDRDDKGYAVMHVAGTYATGCGAQDVMLVLGEASEQFYYLSATSGTASAAASTARAKSPKPRPPPNSSTPASPNRLPPKSSG